MAAESRFYLNVCPQLCFCRRCLYDIMMMMTFHFPFVFFSIVSGNTIATAVLF